VFAVLNTTELAPDVFRVEIEAPRVAKARRPGQFVIVRAAEGEERIPLTIADADAQAGTITLIVQAVGPGTRRIVAAAQAGALRNVAGPLGRATKIERFGRVVCVGGGVGTAVLFPLARALAEADNELITIIGARSAEHVILRDELARFSDELRVTTEDGSLGTKGFVTTELAKLIAEADRRPDAVYAVGPVPMMQAVCEMTRPAGIRTIVSLNPIMVDGTGMCGGCRVTVGDEVKFACVDGPEFDGHQVDFAELARRQTAYQGHRCRLASVPMASDAEGGRGE